ncbi:MAG: metallophosphoesterase [Anaerolineaceae bacterium 4572_32.1]|nr:MAG: metallophosphoesterase [Anaerolineaceae bacterium 4572_32.1]
MKILTVSDHVVEAIYSSRIRERFGDVDMVLSCGDLPYSYLEYIVSMLNVPCFFVHGNHDHPEYTANGRTLTQPGGWINLDERTVKINGILLGGLEGSIRYKPRAPFQYTESEMSYKVWSMTPALLMNRILYGRYLDILITHSPPHGIHDGEDWPHRGFDAFLKLMARFRPRYLLHGHKHVYGPETRRTRYLDTEVINIYPSRVIEW